MGECICYSRSLDGRDRGNEHQCRSEIPLWGWEKGLLHGTHLQTQCSLAVLRVAKFVRYTWPQPWSQVSQLCPGHRKEERLQNYLSNVGDPSVDVGSMR